MASSFRFSHSAGFRTAFGKQYSAFLTGLAPHRILTFILYLLPQISWRAEHRLPYFENLAEDE
ncbi:MAG: hypothetical protein A3J67_01800 [Parcubacteria group bacterium RIFCSPHIGHO2_02_FULL_48_10b]|nr:MAG: hypothetical protein A3J67_01800 [Parcubacteria group bacterium RIFCSPHIGHO2_02_FULL_48_10b]